MAHHTTCIATPAVSEGAYMHSESTVLGSLGTWAKSQANKNESIYPTGPATIEKSKVLGRTFCINTSSSVKSLI